jgi:hypothetical protein
MLMSAVLATVALIVAVAAAVRSTWSPCGRSMLSTITPIGEHGRGHRYRSTVAWFVVGGVVGGTALGAVVGLLALGVAAVRLPVLATTAVAAGVAVVAAASDARIVGFALPIHRRQVNERWLDTFRPWFYGLGFGVQIGSGLATYITTAAVYLFVALAALSGRPAAALGAGALFGLVRGLSVLLSWRVTTPQKLWALHQRLQHFDATASSLVVVVEVVVGLVVVAAYWPPAVVIAGVAAVVVAATTTFARRAPTASSHSS